MHGQKVIGLVGPANAGKDMIAGYMETRKGFKRFAFADRIKKAYYAATGLNEERFKAIRGTPQEAEVRQGLWDYSDRMRAEKGSLCFVRMLMDEVLEYPGDAIITDIRTPDELAAVREAGGKIVLVIRRDAISCDNEKRIPDSRLTFGDIGPEYDVFRNTAEGLEIAHWQLEMFYRDHILRGQQEKTEKAPSADSDPGEPCSDKSKGTPRPV
jgi:hypothetical protein